MMLRLALAAILVPVAASADPGAEAEPTDLALQPVSAAPCVELLAGPDVTACASTGRHVALAGGATVELFRVEHTLGTGFVLAITAGGATQLTAELSAETRCGMGHCDFLQASSAALTKLARSSAFALHIHRAMQHEDHLGASGAHPLYAFTVDQYVVCRDNGSSWVCRSAWFGGDAGACHVTKWPNDGRVAYACASGGEVVLGE